MARATVLLSYQEVIETTPLGTFEVGTSTFTRAQEEADQDDAGAWGSSSPSVDESLAAGLRDKCAPSTPE